MQSVTVDWAGDRIARITLSRPDKMNAIDVVMRDELMASIDKVLDDPRTKAVILTGAGGNFSAGGDIDWMLRQDDGYKLAYHRETMGLVRKLATAPKPTIAAIQGACAGGAAGFALCCDYIVMGESARFGVPFLRIGLVPDMGSGYLLTRRIGDQAARRLILENKMLDGRAAERIGLADLVVPDGDVQKQAAELGAKLAALAPLAVAKTKWLLNRVSGDFDRFIEDELSAQAACLKSPEFSEGCKAFLEKRPARF